MKLSSKNKLILLDLSFFGKVVGVFFFVLLFIFYHVPLNCASMPSFKFNEV